MNPKQIAASVVASVLVVGIVAGTVAKQPEKYELKKEPIRAAQLTSQKSYDSKSQKPQVSFVGVRNGSKVYYTVIETDAGQQKQILPGPTHARRNPKIGPDCNITEPDGGIRDPGDYNRFPIQLSSGRDCESVAGTVYLGQDSQSDQDVSRKR